MVNTELLDKNDAKIYLLYLLKNIYKITEENDIPIYASGGTCLGAVRHKGMIPWDDDIDLMIFRKDYQKFVTLCERLLPSPIVIRTRENDPLFYQEFAKVCFLDDNGKYTELSIDIFELDETNPNRKLFRSIQNFVKSSLYHIKMYKVTKSEQGDFHSKSFAKGILLGFFSFLLPIKTIDKLLLKTLTAEKKSGDYLVNWGAAYHYTKATYPKKAFGTPKKMPFENTYVWAEEYPEMILEQLYGKNYMNPPPPEKRTDHGVKAFTCSKLDFEKIKKEVGM
ncbi:MAG: LicD family protein [Clostridia bacterium]|nr:LicD family protein [Clostridia bacterium]